MTPRRKWTLGILFVFLLVLSFCFLVSIFNPARRSDEAMRDEILKATPLGSTEEVVDRYANSHFTHDNFFHWGENENGKYLTVLYGCYSTFSNFPFSTCVRVYWSFDEDKKLKEISVNRWLDAP